MPGIAELRMAMVGSFDALTSMEYDFWDIAELARGSGGRHLDDPDYPALVGALGRAIRALAAGHPEYGTRDYGALLEGAGVHPADPRAFPNPEGADPGSALALLSLATEPRCVRPGELRDLLEAGYTAALLSRLRECDVIAAINAGDPGSPEVARPVRMGSPREARVVSAACTTFGLGEGDVARQRLTIRDDGRASLTSYGFDEGAGALRLAYGFDYRIGADAARLLLGYIAQRLAAPRYVGKALDAGTWELEVTDDSGTVFRESGSLWGVSSLLWTSGRIREELGAPYLLAFDGGMAEADGSDE